MSTEEENNPNEEVMSSTQSALRAAFGLALFAILTAGLIAFAKLGTNERIIEQEEKARLAALYALVPESYRNNDLLKDSYLLTSPNISEPRTVFIAKNDGQASALVLPWTAPDGYTAPIQLLIAIKTNGELLGVRVVEHKETPGLGDKIDVSKSDWVLSFDGRSLENTTATQWQVKKDGGDFDQLTGATITPRAVVSSVYEALNFFEENKVALLNQSAQSSLDLAQAGQ